jgi:hypothetical protein
MYELWYANGQVSGSRVKFQADTYAEVAHKARCELLMQGIIFDWAWVERIRPVIPQPIFDY